MALFREIQEYIARDANNIARVWKFRLNSRHEMGGCSFQCGAPHRLHSGRSTLYIVSRWGIIERFYNARRRSKARDTRSDKLNENSRMRQVGWKIVSCVIPYDFCRMELDGTRSDSYDVISSFLEKDKIIPAHCFRKKEHGFINNQL